MRRRSETAARQWRDRSRVRVVPDIGATTKAATGSTRLDGVPARIEQALLARSWPVLGTRVAWSGEIRFGERVSSGDGATALGDVRGAHDGYFEVGKWATAMNWAWATHETSSPTPVREPGKEV